MDIKPIFKSVFKIFINSKKDIHVISIILWLILIAINYKYKIISNSDKSSILSGISILSSFFLLTLQNINFKLLNINFTEIITISKNNNGSTENRESVVIRCTIFSLAIMTFLLIGFCFLLNIFDIEYVYILILAIIYLFLGIIYTVVLWNYCASK